MDPVVASWIKEFVLRQNIPQNITDGILAMLPSEPADSESESSLRVRRGILQRRLAEALTRRVITPYTLDTIAGLYALRPLPAAADAYCVVALHFVASAVDFPRAVSDLWARHIPSLLRSPPTAGLASPRLESEVRDLELAVTDDNLRVRSLWRYSKSQALDAVRALLEAEYEDVGPPILELLAENVRWDEAEKVPGGSRAEGTAPEVARQQAARTPSGPARQQAPQTPAAVTEQQATKTPSGAKAAEMPPGEKEMPVPGQSKIDGSQLAKGTTPTVNEGGNSNTAMERDPTACKCRLGKGTTPTSNKVMERDPAAHDSLLGKGTTPTTNEEGNSKKTMERDPAGCNSRLGKGTTPTSNKVMERDPAAHDSRLGKGTTPTTNEEGNSKKTMERDPAACNSRLGKGTTPTMNEKEENSKKAMERDTAVPAYEREGGLKGKAVCPPAMVENKRRKTRRWSVLEEDTLRSAVRELGKGYWKEILRNHSDVFVGRTEVDLKDKWRNMTR